MLHELHISDLGVIGDLDLELLGGLNVLTGETGAGKTMVTVGLSLVAGARASAHLVRAGARAAKVQARFDAPRELAEWSEDGQVILSRTVSADGKGTARISGELSTAAALTSAGARLLEVHGQHQSLRLLEPRTQTSFLDRSAGDAHVIAVAVYREAYDALRAARAALDELQARVRDRERELDLLAYQVHEIDAVAPRTGESDALAAEEARLAHVERLLELAAAVETVLADDGGGTDALASAARGLEAAGALDPGAGGLAARAVGLAAEVADLARDARAYRESLTIDPDRLARIRERTAELQGLHRKYGATDDDVLSFLEEARGRLSALAGADDRAQALEAEVRSLQDTLTERVAVVTRGRAASAPPLAAAIKAELVELGMPSASVEVDLEALPEPGPGGAERVELRFSGGSGQPFLPLAKAVSGGELSRVMLACRSVLADLDEVPTLVFDEVDAGIGGQAGLAVGRRLAALAATRQVLVVTHLPQIACFADRHIRVRKADGLAAVEILDDAERVQELSRMLAGLESSDHAVSHAQELLDEAARVRAGT